MTKPHCPHCSQYPSIISPLQGSTCASQAFPTFCYFLFFCDNIPKCTVFIFIIIVCKIYFLQFFIPKMICRFGIGEMFISCLVKFTCLFVFIRLQLRESQHLFLLALIKAVRGFTTHMSTRRLHMTRLCLISASVTDIVLLYTEKPSTLQAGRFDHSD